VQVTVLKDVLDDGGDRTQEHDYADEAEERDDGRRVRRRALLHFQTRTHQSKSGHVQGVQLLDEAGKPFLLVWSHMDDHSP
jgi:hypothetical protein